MRNQIEQAIADSWVHGTISAGELEAWLHWALDLELAKKESHMNFPLVKACEKLLSVLHAQEITELPDRYAEDWTVVCDFLNEMPRHKPKIIHRAIRVFALAVVMFTLFVVGDSLISNQWLDESHSDDQQQLIIQGQSVDPGLIVEGIATPSEELHQVETQHFVEVVDFLGYTPQMPTLIPEGWSVDTYYAEQYGATRKFIVIYKNPDVNGVLAFTTVSYNDVKSANYEFEQNNIGDYFQTVNGNRIYITYNIGRTLCVWIEGTKLESLRGPCPVEQMVEIIDSIQ